MKSLRFSMKVPIIVRPVSLPSHTTSFLYILTPLLSSRISLSNLSLHHFHLPSIITSPIFSLSKGKSNSMAACIETSQANPLSCDPNRSQSNDNPCKMMKFYRPTFSDPNSCIPISHNRSRTLTTIKIIDKIDREQDPEEDIWPKMKEEARSDLEQEPVLSNYYHNSILSHKSLENALANHLSIKLGNPSLTCTTLFDIFASVLTDDQEILISIKHDLRAVKQRDPACISYVHCFLNFKGFLACQAHRIAHKLWSQNRKALALLIQNRVSEIFGVDIHPGARIGRGILFDHATGIVIGETAVIGNNVSILHNVTLGGTGKHSGDRHPKIGDGVLIGAGTCILGNIKIGDGAKIGASSVVLKDVPARTTAVGNPASLIGGKENPIRLDKIPSFTMDHTSHISDWSDYVI